MNNDWVYSIILIQKFYNNLGLIFNNFIVDEKHISKKKLSDEISVLICPLCSFFQIDR